MATNGIARFGAYGGSCNITQLIDIPHTNLIFRARFQVVQWSTFNSGEPGGYAAVGISFLDSTEKSMATSLYYLNPHGPSQSRRGMHWIRLKPSKPLPTRWFDVVCDLRQELKYHQIRPDLVSKIVIMGIIFGTHEDKVASIGKFASFSLQTTQEQN